MGDMMGATASLLDANTRAATAIQDRDAQRKMKTEELIQSSANNIDDNNAAMARTKETNKSAQFLQTLKDHADLALQAMVQKEESKRKQAEIEGQLKKDEQDKYFTMTPELVKGLRDTTGMDFSKVEGQRVRSDLTIAAITWGAKQAISTDTNNSKGQPKPKDLQAELRRIEGSIKGNRDKLFSISTKDVPEEAWGGQPGNIRMLIQNISGGKLGNLDPNQKSQVDMVAGYINTMKAQQQRANQIHRQLKENPVDYTGMGLGRDEGGTGGGTQKYNSAQEVKAAFAAGQLSREDAKSILQRDFGMQ